MQSHVTHVKVMVRASSGRGRIRASSGRGRIRASSGRERRDTQRHHAIRYSVIGSSLSRRERLSLMNLMQQRSRRLPDVGDVYDLFEACDVIPRRKKGVQSMDISTTTLKNDSEKLEDRHVLENRIKMALENSAVVVVAYVEIDDDDDDDTGGEYDRGGQGDKEDKETKEEDKETKEEDKETKEEGREQQHDTRMTSPVQGYRRKDMMTMSSSRIVGMGRAVSDGALVATLHDIMVHPQYRRLGIGKSIVTHLTQYLDTMMDVIDVGVVVSYDAEMERFLERSGFGQDDEGSTAMVLQLPMMP